MIGLTGLLICLGAWIIIVTILIGFFMAARKDNDEENR